jgi:hypothetical protein
MPIIAKILLVGASQELKLGELFVRTAHATI